MGKEDVVNRRALKPRQGSLKDELLRFVMLSSIRGLSRVLRSRSFGWKIFWLVFVTSSLIVAISLSMNVINSYLSYDTIQELREHFNFPLPFPSVTICNSQAIDKDHYERLNSSLVDGLFNWLEVLRQGYGSSESLLEDRYFLFENLGRNLSHRVGFAMKTLFLGETCVFTFLNSTTGKDSFRSCFENDVRLIQTPRYFNCFMLTPAADIINSTTDLKVDLFLNVPEMLDHYNISHLPYNEDDTTGAHVSMHTPFSWPYTEDAGIDIEPGTKTMIDLSPSKLKFLPHEGELVCSTEHSSQSFLRAHVDSGDTEFAYTRKFCRDLLLQNLTVSKCQCVDPRKPYSPELRNYDFCGKVPGNRSKQAVNWTLNQLRCADNLELDTYSSETLRGHDAVCPLSCETFQYKYQTSQSLWPTKNKEVELYRTVLHEIPHLRQKFAVYEQIHNMSQHDVDRSRKLLLRQTGIRDNFVRLHIFRNDFTASEREMTLKTSAESMISQIGGIFHLLTGITFACVVEVLEFVYYVTKKLLASSGTSCPWQQRAARKSEGAEEEASRPGPELQELAEAAAAARRDDDTVA